MRLPVGVSCNSARAIRSPVTAMAGTPTKETDTAWAVERVVEGDGSTSDTGLEFRVGQILCISFHVHRPRKISPDRAALAQAAHQKSNKNQVSGARRD